MAKKRGKTVGKKPTAKAKSRGDSSTAKKQPAKTPTDSKQSNKAKSHSPATASKNLVEVSGTYYWSKVLRLLEHISSLIDEGFETTEVNKACKKILESRYGGKGCVCQFPITHSGSRSQLKIEAVPDDEQFVDLYFRVPEFLESDIWQAWADNK
jgi:hypothetical protein